MLYTNLILSTLLASAAATAIPGLTRVDRLTKRSEKIWDPKGNLKLTFSSESVQIGVLTVDSIIGSLGQVCHESGQCETNDIELKSTLYGSDSVTGIKVTLGPDGTYPTWIRNGLLDSLAAAAKAVAKCEDGTYTNTCPGTTAMAYCPRKQTKFTNCEVPKYWGVNFQSPDVPNAAPPALGVDIAMEKEDTSGICEDAMTGIGAVAGAVNGVAGGIFTLLTFACT